MAVSTDFIEEVMGLIVFEISGKEFSASIKDIYTVIKPNYDEQPGLHSPFYPHLLINKKKIPVINLHKFFGLKAKAETDESRILIVESSSGHFGFYVESVKEVFTISMYIREKLTFISSSSSMYLKGKIRYKERVLNLPDFEKIAGDHLVMAN
ncbi:MAG: chemotaxis protein CheW [Bacillota bacterium]